MEWLIALVVMLAIEIAAFFRGSDSRPGVDEAPYSAL